VTPFTNQWFTPNYRWVIFDPNYTGAKMSNDRKTLTVPEAGREYFGLSKNASYAAAVRGEIPTIRVGRLLRVPVRALEAMLDRAGAE
jgi:hypothetical protein